MNWEEHYSLNSKSQIILSPLPLRCQGNRLIAEDDVSAQHLEAAQSVLIISTGQIHHREPRNCSTSATSHYLQKPLPSSGWCLHTQHGLPTVTHSGMVGINGSVARDHVYLSHFTCKTLKKGEIIQILICAMICVNDSCSIWV